MEKNFYTDDFEQLLKEKSDQFRMYPSKRVWHSIYNDLHPGRKWPSVAMSMLLILALLLIGHLNTSDNTIINNKIADNTGNQNSSDPAIAGNTKTKKHASPGYNNQPLATVGSEPSSSIADIANATGTASSSLVNNPDPTNANNIFNTSNPNNFSGKKTRAVRVLPGNNNKGVVETIDTYIKTNQIFADIAALNKKKKIRSANPSSINSINNTNQGDTDLEELTIDEKNTSGLEKPIKKSTDVNLPVAAGALNSSEPGKPNTADVNENPVVKNGLTTSAGNKSLSPEDKAWIENYAMHNKPVRKKWKGRTAIEFYATPAVNYRQLNSETKGSATPFANNNINNSVSHKPGLGIEAGAALAYTFAKNMRIKAGIQFNYTNYGINADETNHPVSTSLLLNEETTGFSYMAIRTSTLSNAHSSSALKPVTIHNTTYQVSIPVGIAFKLATNKKLEWFAGASIQPTYIFGGKAHLISTDLKDYVSEPSAIRNWNLNTGIETYVNYKLGCFTLQAGPQVRYQLFSTYRKNYALVEKPYAVGLKIGIVKGF